MSEYVTIQINKAVFVQVSAEAAWFAAFMFGKIIRENG